MSRNLFIENVSRLYTPITEGGKPTVKMVEDAVVVITQPCAAGCPHPAESTISVPQDVLILREKAEIGCRVRTLCST
jgi:hypothetical protein